MFVEVDRLEVVLSLRRLALEYHRLADLRRLDLPKESHVVTDQGLAQEIDHQDGGMNLLDDLHLLRREDEVLRLEADKMRQVHRQGISREVRLQHLALTNLFLLNLAYFKQKAMRQHQKVHVNGASPTSKLQGAPKAILSRCNLLL